jgi:hypothetical protein
MQPSTLTSSEEGGAFGGGFGGALGGGFGVPAQSPILSRIETSPGVYAYIQRWSEEVSEGVKEEGRVGRGGGTIARTQER